MMYYFFKNIFNRIWRFSKHSKEIVAKDHNRFNFQKLTPKPDVDLKIYEDAFNYVFQEDDLKNVAITGSYGAGKSSVLESYKNKHLDKAFLNISLAHFDSVCSESINDEETKENEDVRNISMITLEGKILNQLLHQINLKKIPQTHFKVKRDISKRKICFNSIFATISFVLIIYIFRFEKWSNFIHNLPYSLVKRSFLFTTNINIVFLAGLIFIGIIAFALYSVIKMIQNNIIVLKKLNLKGSEIEILEDNDSYFNKYLNEVIYLFCHSGAQVIVFEDMDRFNNNEIFQKLREINYMVNSKSNKIIRFFYLLRDDTFTSKERTKFFDFIIPIVPVVDNSNSYDQFISHFKDGGIFKKFDESFLQGLALYIDDMRILKNIYNEYVIYYELIQSTELKHDKLLAIISYKNIFPRDFSELQLGRGFVYNLFSNKLKYVESTLQNIEAEIQKKEQQVRALDNELCREIEELDAIYLVTDILDINGQKESQFPSKASFIKAMKDDPNNIFVQAQGYGRQRYYNFQNDCAKLSSNVEYNERKRLVEMKSLTSIDSIKNEIIELQRKKSTIETQKLSNVITKENIDDIFSVTFTNEIGQLISYKDVKSSHYFSLIKYLIRNGYIDETYPDYMTYFYEYSLSRNDKIFLRSVTDEVAEKFSYNLNDPALVVSRLRDIDFDHEETLNFSLFGYLLETNHPYLITFINQLKNKDRIDFVIEFWSIRQDTPKLINLLNHQWPLLFRKILDNTHVTEIQKRQYTHDTLLYSPEDDLVEVNIDNLMTKYISNDERFLNNEESDISRIVSNLRSLNVKFKQLDGENVNYSLLKAIYKEDLYQLNVGMIYLILDKIYGFPKDETYKHRNYSLIVSKPEEPLVKYVRKNIEEYIDIDLRNCESKITDDEKVALEILNNQDISIDNKAIYASYLQTTIERIESISDKALWDTLLKNRVLRYSGYNVLQYYFNSGSKLNPTLIEFVNGDDSKLTLDYEQISNDFGETEASNLYDDLVACESLLDEKYELLVKDLNWHYEEFSFKEMSYSKLNILIDCGLLFMNEDNLEFVRENYPKNLLYFIVKNIDLYVNAIDDKNFVVSELYSLLEMDIPDTYKLKLLNYASEPISIKGKRFSENIISYILRNNLETSDIPYLVDEYMRNSLSLSLIELMKMILIEHVDYIISEECILPFDLLTMLLGSNEVDEEDKYSILDSRFFDLVDERQAITCFEKLGLSEFIKLLKGGRRKIEITNRNRKLLGKLITREWISSFNVDKQDENYFRAIGRKAFQESF